MDYILGTLFLLILLFLFNNFMRKKKLKKKRAYLNKSWGAQKKDNYYNFYVISKYFDNNSHKKKAYHIISEQNKIDFDIDDVFKFIDRTSSKIGQQYLYFKLRTITPIHDVLKFDVLTSLFKNNKKLAIDFQMELSKLNSNNSYYLEELINGKQIDKPKVLRLVKLLTIVSISFLFLSIWKPILGFILIPIWTLNMFFHYKNKESISYYLNGVTQLSKALKVSGKLNENNNIKNHFNDTSFLKRIKKIQFKTEFIAFEKNLDNEFLFAFWFVGEIIKIMFNLEYLMFYSFVDAISKEKQSIEDLFCFIGEIDSAISVASLSTEKHIISKPTFNQKNELKVSEIYHPLIENCITNNLNLNKKSVLLTGSNMSGKTTFIRTIAVNSILAQTLNITFSKSYNAPFYKVYSSIRITDDLLDDTSYYLQEVLRVKELIAASNDTNPCLFVLDEIFKGTNTIERISGGKAILSYLNKNNHTVIVSTHDIELTELLTQNNYNLYHFSEQIIDHKLFFDHKIKEGKLKTRNAIKILEMYKYPKEITTDAKKVEADYFT